MTPQEQEAFDKGRLQGLNEMDEAYVEWFSYLMSKCDVSGSDIPSEDVEIRKLRQEYSGK